MRSPRTWPPLVIASIVLLVVAACGGPSASKTVDPPAGAAPSPTPLEPGGYHLMLLGVAQLPAVGGTVELTLTFEHVGDIVVQAEVRAG
jgi:copper(I)-binding protein